jgi:hypothetical protein
MGVDDFRPPERIQTASKLDPTQQRETQDVIGIILHLRVMIRITRSVIEMRGINQIDAHAVKVAKQQRHRPGEGLPAGHHLRFLPVADRGNPGSSTRVSTPSAICAAGRAPVTSASRFQQREHLRSYM